MHKSLRNDGVTKRDTKSLPDVLVLYKRFASSHMGRISPSVGKRPLSCSLV